MTTLWFLFCDKIIVKVSVLLIKSPASLPLPLSPPSSFFHFFFRSGNLKTGWLLARLLLCYLDTFTQAFLMYVKRLITASGFG